MINHLNQPYKLKTSNKWKWSLTVATGLFVFVFLVVFKPSPYIYEQPPFLQFIFSLGFGLIVSTILFIFKFIIEPKMNADNWTLRRSIEWGLFISACIGVASYLYTVILFENNFQIQFLAIYLKYFFYSIFTAVLIGIVPITIHHLLNHMLKYRSELTKAGLLADDEVIWENEVIIRAGRGGNEFCFNPRLIVYISSDDNYISVWHREGELLKRTLIRGSLKAVEDDLSGNSKFIRCHRSHIVNMSFFSKRVGHSQNMRLTSSELNLEIPVSRSISSYISEILPD
mgnify:CR=1 FL=1